MKDFRRAHVTRSQPHSPLELAERLPPAPLPEVEPPQVHEGELTRFVAFGLVSLFKPRNRLVQLVLLHQVDPDVVVRVAELGIDLDRAEALLGGLRYAALEAHGPPQEGMCLCCRVHLDGMPVELDRAIQLSPYVAAVGLPPEFRRLPQSLSFFHFSPAPWSPGTSAFFEPILRESRHDLFRAPQSIPCSCSIHVIRLLAALVEAGHRSPLFAECGGKPWPRFPQPSLERSGSISELYMASGRPSRLRAWVGADSRRRRSVAGLLAPLIDPMKLTVACRWASWERLRRTLALCSNITLPRQILYKFYLTYNLYNGMAR